MNTDKEQMRAEFEAWIKEKFPGYHLGSAKVIGAYTDFRVQAKWEIWQAAIASRAQAVTAVPEGWQILPKIPFTEMKNAGMVHPNIRHRLAGECYEAMLMEAAKTPMAASACPVCGVSGPHQHSSEEVVAHRNRMKAAPVTASAWADDADLVCVERGGDGAVCANDCHCGKAADGEGELPALPEPRHRGPDGTGAYFDSFTVGQMHAYARAALAQRPASAEPVAYLKQWDSVGGAQQGIRRLDFSAENEPWLAAMFPTVTPLYAHPTTAADSEDAARLAKLLEFCTEAKPQFGPTGDLRAITMKFKSSVETSTGYCNELRKLIDNFSPAARKAT